MNTAIIFDIQRNSFVDGPGIRTTVFFKGCNLKCKWCHNPESQSPKPQIMFYKEKCTGCGRCKGITEKDTDFVCFNDAKRICGKEYTVEEVFDIIRKDKPFYETSNGGVTFSGGECMLQIDFLCEIAKKCKDYNIHTAIDTAGYVPWESFERIMPYTDLFLYDIKSFHKDIHRKFVGVPNELILHNLSKLLERKANVTVRIPVIPTVNDSMEEMKNIRNFLAPYEFAAVELLPYHKMGEHKYAALGMQLTSFRIPSREKMKELNDFFQQPEPAQEKSHEPAL